MRAYTSRRDSIVSALAEKLKVIDGTGDYLSNLYENVKPVLEFVDEIDDFPAVRLNAGPESREYLGAGHSNRYMSVMVRCYVREDDSVTAINKILEDVETVIEDNSRLAYTDRQGNTQHTKTISVISIDTDEGVFNPLGIAEIQLEIMY